MHAELDAIEAQVLKLSPQDRARLLDRLIISLDEDPLREAAWNALAAARDAEIEDGSVQELDGPASIARLKAKYA